jgi:squalene-hopene/tetraprenyl-beta-curcumene cyclase
MAQTGPAVTAMVVKGLLHSGLAADDPRIVKALAYIETFRQADGGYYRDAWPNYCTSIVLSLFAELPRDAYAARIAKAQDFLRSIQSVEGSKDNEGKTITKDHPWYGGAGYAGKGARRPDMSNTSYFVDGLISSGVKPSDRAIQAALVFIARCQMNSETNTMAFAKGHNDGGFVYSTFNGGESEFGKTPDRAGNEVLVEYGSMTYAGLKSFIYAGLTKDDPRVQAAWRWITSHWTLDANPGTTSQQGLFYYYHTFAKALRAYGADEVTDAKGVRHDWRKELEEKLASLQQPDGSFRNDADRWMEASPELVTAYSVLALQEARK